MMKFGLAKSTNELLERARNGWIVFLESAVAKFYTLNDCNLQEVGDQIGSWYYSMMLVPNSPLKTVIDEL